MVRMELREAELKNDNGTPVLGVIGKCTRCGNEASAFGTGEPSIKRVGAELGRTCRLGEDNFYVADLPPELPLFGN